MKPTIALVAVLTISCAGAVQQGNPSATRLYKGDVGTAFEQAARIAVDLAWGVTWADYENHSLIVLADSGSFTIQLFPTAGNTVRVELSPESNHGGVPLLPLSDPRAQRLFEALDERLPRP